LKSLGFPVSAWVRSPHEKPIIPGLSSLSRLLKTDKVVSGMEPTLGDLGVHPQPLEEFLTVFKAKPS
jgi:hypothetical protein